ncbi:PREDICTED: transforming growth factor-beta-induced protein ig-h3-like [Branchiostoma belcheri]|uniref:Transforming growth factor-beta-induced protein ig-h3-like n=1 Tax=Branchiostoma belcheri TaxID=7741 RepID=A0A6P4ZKX4_BRABE|nr:PREDICTED: transforming growth factor-beta-induced protein ig-h3-like [Branchiostoma belcheri]
MKFVTVVLYLVCVVSAQNTVVDVLKTLGTEGKLIELVQKAKLDSRLEGKGPFTVFAPTDDAFSALPGDLLAKLEADNLLLTQVLEFHVASGKAMSSGLKNNQLVPTLIGLNIRINIYNTSKPSIITADGAVVTKADNVASNGVVHVIDQVLWPLPTASIAQGIAANFHLSTLGSAVSKAGLVATLSGDGPFTVFAPTNEAFSKLPAGVLDGLLKNVTALTDVLTYHVLPGAYYLPGLRNGDMLKTLEGGNVTIKNSKDAAAMVNNATIIAQLAESNGVLMLIDTVLIPPPKHFELAEDKM